MTWEEILKEVEKLNEEQIQELIEKLKKEQEEREGK